MDIDEMPPIDLPGFAPVVRHGAGSAAGWQYTEALGLAIAALLATSPEGGLSGLHDFAPDRIPPPAIIAAWRRQFPAFGLAMRDAERVRAEVLIEQTIVIADTGQGAAPRLALQIAARQHLAGKLDVGRYGKGDPAGQVGALASDPQPVALEMDDATLAGIAMQGQESARAPA